MPISIKTRCPGVASNETSPPPARHITMSVCHPDVYHHIPCLECRKPVFSVRCLYYQLSLSIESLSIESLSIESLSIESLSIEVSIY